MSLLEFLFGHEKPKVDCRYGDRCDLIRITVADNESSESYRWQCKKCDQQYFYSDSFLNGKKITTEKWFVLSLVDYQNKFIRNLLEKQKLFVGNLNFETTEEDINHLFSTYGTVKSIRIRPKKGTAFVEMSTPEEAGAAMAQLDQSEFKDRPLRISLELSKKKARTITRDRFKNSSKKKSSGKRQ